MYVTDKSKIKFTKCRICNADTLVTDYYCWKCGADQFPGKIRDFTDSETTSNKS